MRYSFSSLRTAISHPWIVRREVGLFGRQLNQAWYQRFPADSDQFMNADWDTLILLDSCRYTDFAAAWEDDGKLSSRTSPGSESWEFMQAEFVGEQHHDTVYVTANPYTGNLEPGIFHTVDPVYQNYDRFIIEPEPVAQAARQAHERYPDKRIIVHFMQPHQPYIGSFGQTLPHSSEFGETIWMVVRDLSMEPTIEDVRRAYRENLSIVTEHAMDLYEEITGKVIISADHGELLGERLRPIPVRDYGHHPSLHVPELITVPWLELPHQERRSITQEPPDDQDLPEATEDQLDALGYV